MNPPLNANKIVFASEEEIRAHSRAVVTSILERHRGHEHATLNELGSDKCCSMFEGQILRQVEKKGIDAVIEEHANLIILTKKFDPNIQASSSSGSSAPQNSAPPVCGPSKVFKVNFIVNQGFSVDTSAMISALNEGFSSTTPGLGPYGNRKQLDTKIRFEFESLTTLTGSQIKSFSSKSNLWFQILADPSDALDHGFKEDMFNVYFANFNTPQDFGAFAYFPASFPASCCVVWPTFSTVNLSDPWAFITIIHEFGHSFSLSHTFGDGGGTDCGDDSVSDTPLQHSSTNWTRSNMCGDGLSMNENWMDYNSSPPVSNYFFTVGQNARMQASITTSLAGYYTEVPGELCGSCCDGLGNCTETTAAGCIAPSVWTIGQTCSPNPCAGGGGGGGGGLGVVNVKYGNFDFAENNLFVPYLSRDQESVSYKGKFGQITKITLEGALAGSYSQIDPARSLILGAFLEDFKTLTVKEYGVIVIEFERCVVKSVNFSPANGGRTEYQIELECLEQNLFGDFYGILNPKNEYSFSEQENGFIEVKHSISAVGFLTNGASAMQNAKAFVNSKLGYNPATLIPALMPFLPNATENNISIILTQTSSSADDTSAKYSTEESFLIQDRDIDLVSKTLGVVSSATSSFKKNLQDDFSSVDVSFTIQGGINTLESNLRSKIPNPSALFAIASKASGAVILNPVPLLYNVTDNASTSKTIEIKVSYDSNPFLTFFDYSIDFSTDYITGITTSKITGEIKTRGGITNKYEVAKAFYEEEILEVGVRNYLFDLAQSSYINVMDLPWPLNPNYDSISITENKNKGIIKLEASFSNKDFLNNCLSANYSISVKPTIKKYQFTPSCTANGLYAVTDVNQVTQEEIIVDGSISVAQGSSAKAEYVNFINNLKSNLVDTQILFDAPILGGAIVDSEAVTESGKTNERIKFNHSFKVDSYYVNTN